MSPASDAPCTLFWPRNGWSPVPGRPIWPVIIASAIRQRALSVPCTCCEMPIPHRIIDARDFAKRRRVDAAHRRHRFRAVARDVVAQLGVAARAIADERFGDQALLDD